MDNFIIRNSQRNGTGIYSGRGIVDREFYYYYYCEFVYFTKTRNRVKRIGLFINRKAAHTRWTLVQAGGTTCTDTPCNNDNTKYYFLLN